MRSPSGEGLTASPLEPTSFDLLALEPGCEPLLKSMRLVVSGAGPDHLFEDAERRFGFQVVRDYVCRSAWDTRRAAGRSARVAPDKDGVPFPGTDTGSSIRTAASRSRTASLANMSCAGRPCSWGISVSRS